MSEQVAEFFEKAKPEDIPFLIWEEFLLLSDDDRRRYVQTINERFGIESQLAVFNRIFFCDHAHWSQAMSILIGKEFKRLGIRYSTSQLCGMKYAPLEKWMLRGYKKTKERMSSQNPDAPHQMVFSVDGTADELNALLKKIQELAPNTTLISMKPISK